MASLLSLLIVTLAAAGAASLAAASRFGKIPSLSPTHEGFQVRWSTTSTAEDDVDQLKTLFYNQTLDHFNYAPQSYVTFQQRYVINSRHFTAGTAGTILVYFGAEAPLDNDLRSIGFLSENGATFGALLVYIEHRFYGRSIPGGRSSYVKDKQLRGYFNSAQAMADYAEIILQVKQDFNAHDSPVIVIGGSYGGMLASWFRLKYPHIALGALASSAPILYFDDITSPHGYYDLVSKDFMEVSESCYQTIKNSWLVIQEIATLQDGLSILSRKFNTCKPLNDSSELINYLESMYASAAQYNDPLRNPISAICRGIEGATASTTATTSDEDKRLSPLLSKIFAGVVAINGVNQCYVNQPKLPSETAIGWRWQTCSEMVFPIGIGNNTMFPPDAFDLTVFSQQCLAFYGVSPRPHWVTTFYGGHSIKLVLKRFGSNIIFSNGLKDPYSSGGVLENISDSIVAVHTVNGSHCLDIVRENERDPDWLKAQRKLEIGIIQGWISQYHDDLHKGVDEIKSPLGNS
ncbi:Lysosomal Pro-X carboxypeptidase [Linum perenne]